MKITSILIAAMLLAAPSIAKPHKGGGRGGAVITGTYAGATFDSYVVFEVHVDGTVSGTVEHDRLVARAAGRHRLFGSRDG